MTAKPRKTTTRPLVVETAVPGRPNDHQKKATPTSAKGWKKNGAVLTLPSDNVIRLKNPGILELAHKGLIPNALMSVIMGSIQKGREPRPDEILNDQIDISEMFAMMDNAIIEMAVDPVVLPVPTAGEERDPDALYVDELDEQDKMFIWHWATGGSSNIEQFRSESANLLASIPGQPTVELPAKRAASRKK